MMSSFLAQKYKIDPFVPGQVVEAKMCCPNHPTYWDTWHPVQVLEVHGNEYYCQLLAWPGEYDRWTREQLRPCQHDRTVPQPGDTVQFRWANRTVRGVREVDGFQATLGVWVKAKVIAISGNRVMVEHLDWDHVEDNPRARCQRTLDINEVFHL